MPQSVSNRERLVLHTGQPNPLAHQQQDNDTTMASLPLLLLARIFEFAARDQRGFETTGPIRSTCQGWKQVNDETLLPQLYANVRAALRNHPFFQSIPEFQRIVNGNSDEMKSLALFKNLSRAINAPCLLFPEQYLRSHQQLEDDSLVTVWESIKKSIDFQGGPIPSRPQEIRDWISNPDNNDSIQAITDLDLRSMNLQLLPQEIGAFVNLQWLNLSDNRLRNLPETFGNLRWLNSLDLQNNNLESLPKTFGKLRQLNRLDLQNNHLKSLPETFGNLRRLDWLQLSDNHLENLPETIGNLQQLTSLYLGNNDLKSLPMTIGNLWRLTVLNLSGNHLEKLPETIGNLQQLISLYILNNHLESLPGAIGNFQQLRTLYVANNPLKSLPETIGNLQQLSWLDLQNTHLKSLPETIGNLYRLNWLDLQNTHLESLPKTIGNLQQLRTLYLQNNRLKSLPKTIRNLRRLAELRFENNLCLFLLDKEFSTFASSYAQKTLEKYRACREYAPKTPFARLCQLIHNQADKDLLQPTLREIPQAMQAKLQSRTEDIWTSLPEHQQVENKDLLKANAIRVACHERDEILNQAIIEILKETFSVFTKEQKHLVYDLVWELAGRPEGDDRSRENHAEDNIIRLIDAVAIMLSEQGQG